MASNVNFKELFSYNFPVSAHFSHLNLYLTFITDPLAVSAGGQINDSEVANIT